MASPAFIYAFDNLEPERFVRLCGLLLGARHKGFLLSGPGPDGGVDAEVSTLGEWVPETTGVVNNTIVPARKPVVFQLKHKVVSRVGGQAEARAGLLKLFKSTKKQQSEVCGALIAAKKPEVYVLVTNVEVNTAFRQKFTALCKRENPSIRDYLIIGLDDLASWVEMDGQLRHLYFPALFGPPRFDLRIGLELGFAVPIVGRTMPKIEDKHRMLEVAIMNVGLVTSYPAMIRFKTVSPGKPDAYALQFPIVPGEIDPFQNPTLGTPVEAGRCQVHRFGIEFLRGLRSDDPAARLVEVRVRDEIGNWYSAEVTDEIRDAIFPPGRPTSGAAPSSLRRQP